MLLGLASLLAACGGDSTSTGGTSAPPTLQSIAVTASPASVVVGATSQFTAVGTYSNGTTQTITTTVTWTSATTSVATIVSSGLATSVAAGTTVITATSGSISGTATLTVTAATATVTSIAVTPATPSIAAGTTEQFTATATLTNGSTQVLTASTTPAVTWQSGNTAAATIASTGIATGVAVGSAVMTATASGVSGSTTLTVTAATMTKIAIAPSPPSVIAGSTSQLSILATYTDGTTNTVAGTSGAWTYTGSASIASIGASTGIVTGIATGTGTVGVTYGGLSAATATLTVTPAEYAFVTNFAQNTVSSFSVGPGGSLVANGADTPTGSQPFALAPDSTGHFLYVGNYSSEAVGSISEYSIGANGQLTSLGTVSSGAGPNGMTVHNGYVYVANFGDSTVGWYAINMTSGTLTPLSGSTEIVSDSGSSGAAAIAFDGSFAYVPNYLSNSITVFSVNATTGALSSPVVIQEPAGSAGGPVAITFDSSGKYAYVADSGNASHNGDISQYSVDSSTGTLTAMSAPTVPVSGNPSWITVDTTSNTAYVTNTYSSSVQVLSIGTGGALTLSATQALALNTTTNSAANPSYVTLDPTDNLLYVAERGGTYSGQTAPFNDSLAQFSVSATGTLSPLAMPTVTSGVSTTASQPVEIALTLAY